MRSTPAMLDFLSPLSIVPGMGPKRLAAMNEADITTVGELLYRFPLRYIDRSVITPLDALEQHLDTTCTVTGTVENVRLERGKKARLHAVLRSESGTIELLWFQGVTFYQRSISNGVKLLATGKIGRFGKFQMVHPVIEQMNDDGTTVAPPVLPLYGLTGEMREAGANQRFRRKVVTWILDHCSHFPEVLPPAINSKQQFPPIATCLKELHFPTNVANLEQYRARIRYEELYQLAVTLYFSRRKFMLPGRALKQGAYLKQFIATLPFILTADQKNAIDVLLGDIAAPARMHRLLQGDVGSGKTVVAFCATLPALDAGLQVVWMAPTEILARQTATLINKWLAPLGHTAACCTGAQRESGELHNIKRQLANGTCSFVVGTHALLQPAITFNKVGIFVIDEQHRFGAAQRLLLNNKDTAADILMMSATPIPQTLAQTLYGDLDIVSIRMLPPGRIPVATYLVPETKRTDMEQFIARELINGAQCYYIVPRIEADESAEETTPEVADLATTFRKLTSGTFKQHTVAFLHGKLTAIGKEGVLDDFYSKKCSLLVATTVVEVGLDVPDATMIVIENSERFGLAQLHQLRGRVGRGNKKSFCFLLHAPTNDNCGHERLQRFCKNNDGFSIAELDLQFRGPGEVTGFRQSGWEDLIMADILRDAELFSEIRQTISQHFNTL